METIFITGSTGYLGTRLIAKLLEEGYCIKALCRKGAAYKLPPGCEIITGDALLADSYKDAIAPASVFIHLVGVGHPSPRKQKEFQQIDLVSVQQAVLACKNSGITHFIYLSVAQYPTRMMRIYQLIRKEGEKILIEEGIPSSFMRPWYVLGPGHWWPVILMPVYLLMKLFTPAAFTQLQIVTIRQMINALIYAVKNPPDGCVWYEVKDIKKF
jgi:uncharacterized protein YbjT (DUF2867 family)